VQDAASDAYTGRLRQLRQRDVTSYGAPIELFSVDPASGAPTELADTSITNLLAELPVLEMQANGANLGPQLADGTQIQFASTARLATFLYAVAVQQMQATSFVTNSYNLDMQWLNTVDQPLLDEALYWSERAKAEASIYPERTIEDNTQASMALQIAAEAPSSRQNMTVTINNAATGTKDAHGQRLIPGAAPARRMAREATAGRDGVVPVTGDFVHRRVAGRQRTHRRR
jgi:hypothetical protein